jgi:MoxR-like ATPase
VQFTPDTLPSDITGFASYNKDSTSFVFNRGAIFCNLFLADELNRTSSRTQAALLEAMEEQQITVEGKSYKLEKPFSVIATQNPIGASGTQLLPDSQTDRFMVRISMGYPDGEAECKMLLNRACRNPLDDVEQVVTKQELIDMQEQVKSVYIKKEVAKYIVELIAATRNNSLISRGASPRATLALTSMSKAVAFAENRDYIIPRDVQNVFLNTICHRIILSPEAFARKLKTEQVLKDILQKTKQPRI